MLSRSSFLCCCSQGSASSTVIPSIPGAPLLALTRLCALFRLSLLRMRSSKSAPSVSLLSRTPALCAPAYSSCSALSLCRQPSSFRFFGLTIVRPFPHFFCGTMASADFSQFVVTTRVFFPACETSPGTHTFFHPYTRLVYRKRFRAAIGLWLA